ncbi:hypothetical protein Pan241w_48500 [Gimesia alba]|uniref:Uncharacterized protein n=1 Tax=Gimesia alba TaxID=2527973 RepID=A0A517RLH5_9PLAN|nr:hypothetical protein [Gimesia alba]QDT44734.1 hypothetical protein Pan241w_48500 [Gimesia alba]
MGTRINVLFPHQLADWSNREMIMDLLNDTLPSVLNVEAYWPEKETAKTIESKTWVARPPHPYPFTRDFDRYSGPGPLFVSVNPSVAHLRTGGRWRGFLSIQQLRSVHISAFLSIANAFAAPTMRLYPDNDLIFDKFAEGGDFDACSSILDQIYDTPIPLEENIDPVLAVETDTGCPTLQYIYTL